MPLARRVAAVIAMLIILGLALLAHRSVVLSKKEIRLKGEAFGSTYSIVAHAHFNIPEDELTRQIDTRLKELGAVFSLYDPNSELSRINAAPAGVRVTISADLHRVLSESMRLSAATDGAYDITVGPLVSLWGFGPGREPAEAPSDAAIAEARSHVGYRHIVYDEGGLTKLRDGMVLDFSSKAPGYAVDEIARILRDAGCQDYLIEIGGEIDVEGRAPTGQLWTIGVESPEEGMAPGERLEAAIRLPYGAVSTSGSYRRFKELGGRHANHIIDPRTGAPASSAAVSVTVLAPACTVADGLGTALMVMGVDEGLRWIALHPGLEAMFLVKTGHGFARKMSPGFAEYLTPLD